MRTILVTDDPDEYSKAWERLTHAGIPVLEPPKLSNMPGLRVGANTRTLCIWLDHQYDDALQLLRDPDHPVTTGISGEAFEAIQHEADSGLQQAQARVWETVLNLCAIGTLLLLLAGLVYLALRG